MIKVFSLPPEDTNTRYKRVFLKILPAIICVIISTVPLFYFMFRDSEKNSDAVYKITSQQTEAALIFTAGVTLLAVVWISAAGICESVRYGRRFTGWAYYRCELYTIKANYPKPYSGAGIRTFSRVMSAQESILRFLSDKYTLKQLLDGEIQSDRFEICRLERVQNIRKTGKGAVIMFDNGRKAVIYRSMDGYDELLDILENLKND